MNRTKQLFGVLIALLSVLPLTAQDLLDAIAQETCDCIGKKDLEGMAQEKINLELGICMMESFSSRDATEMAKLEVDITDQSSINKFAEKIGIRMAVKCPSTLQKVAATNTVVEQETVVMGTIEGTIKEVTDGEFSYIIVEDGSGRSHKLLWLRYFKGSETISSNPESAKGKKAKITYAPIECYSPKAKDYYDQKEIKSLELQ